MDLFFLSPCGFFQKVYTRKEVEINHRWDPLGINTDSLLEHQKFSKEKEAAKSPAPFLVNSMKLLILPLFLPMFHLIFILPPWGSPHSMQIYEWSESITHRSHWAPTKSYLRLKWMTFSPIPAILRTA